MVDDEVGARADLVDELAGRLLDPACRAGRHGAQFGKERIRCLVETGEELRSRGREAAGDIVRRVVDRSRDVCSRLVEIGDEFCPRLGDALDVVGGNALQALRHEGAALLDHLRGVEAGTFEAGGHIFGGGLEMEGEVAARGLHDVGQVRHLLLDLVGRGDGCPFDGPRDVLVDSSKLVDRTADRLGHVQFHVLNRSAEIDGIIVECGRGLVQLFDLARELAREIAQLADHLGRDILHVRSLHADLGARRIGALCHVVHGADDAAGEIAQPRLETAEHVLCRHHDAVERLGVGLEPGEEGIGIVIDDERCLMQGRALVLDAGDEGTDTLLVAAEGALDGGDFLVHDLLEHRGALHGMLDAADEKVDLGADRLGNGCKSLGRDVLGAHEAHGGLVKRFRYLAHVRSTPEDESHAPDDGNGDEEQRQGLQRAAERLRAGARLVQDSGMGEKPAAGPQGGEQYCDRGIGREGRAAAQPRQHHGSAGIVLVGGPASHRSGFRGEAGRLAPGGVCIARATVWTARLSGVCHILFPALSNSPNGTPPAPLPEPRPMVSVPGFFMSGQGPAYLRARLRTLHHSSSAGSVEPTAPRHAPII